MIKPMSDNAQKDRAPIIVEGSTVVTTEVVERPAAERPAHDSIEAISEWLIGPARGIASATRALDEYAWRLHAAGMPLLRVSLHSGTLHPQFLGAAYVWWLTTAQTQEIMIMHEVADLLPYEENPVRRVRQGGETLRRVVEAGKGVMQARRGKIGEHLLAGLVLGPEGGEAVLDGLFHGLSPSVQR